MNTTDKELLELAAKAAGFELGNEIGEYGWWHGETGWLFARRNANGTSTPWNPLTADGDALRLAVKLNISVTQYPIYEYPKHSVLARVPSLENSRTEVVELYNNDPYAATRRAIVRAAAEIGRSMNDTRRTT